jgi:murein DD-endopeptidase MepM/ murein hydrolase activator NlpD
VVVRRSLFVGLVTLLTAASALVVAPPVLADPHGDKSRVDQELAQVASQYEDVTDAARGALAAYRAAAAQLPAAQRKLADAKGTVIARQVEAREAQRQADAATAQVAAADAKVSAADAKVDSARQAVSDLTAQVYQGSAILGFNALLESSDTSSLADAVAYLDEIATARSTALEHFVVARGAAATAANGLRAARDAAAQAAQVAKDALAQAQAAQQQAQDDTDAVQALVDRQQQALTTANAQRDAVLAHYNELKAEAAAIEAQLAALARSNGAATNAPPLRPGAILLMPVHGAYKSSDFGMRYDPYYHVWQLHAGVDLAVPTGTPIYAAMPGKVVWASWRGGNGNYTCIDNGLYQGRDLTTCYAHQSKFLVSVGQSVQRGQEIGLVGSTGASTGSHLHFEVRLNGTPVQPLDWLPACLC